MKTIRPLLAAACVAAILFAGFASSAAPKKILVVTVTTGFRHSSIPTAENVLATLGERTGLFTVDYGRTAEDLESKMSPEGLKNYDGVIFANTTTGNDKPNLPIPDKQAFVDWVKAGHAFAGMHSASDTYEHPGGFPGYVEMLGGSFQTHGAQVEVEPVIHDPGHPATRHFPKGYKVFDEIYIIKDFNRDAVHPLLGLEQHPNNKTPGYFPISWTREPGKGRVFYTSLGHREDVWTSALYQEHILGGIAWALHLEKENLDLPFGKSELSAREKREGFRPLFDGKDLKGWKLRHADGKQSWAAQDGVLVNTVTAGEHGTDLVTEETFRDFVIRYEYQVPPGSNSGLYLRGRHEIQIFDDYARNRPDMGGNGAIYSVKPVSIFASRKPGQWQEVEAKIQGNHVSVILNGVKVHDSVEVNKATGGELDSNLDEPGPILLQGDHGSVQFRNIRIKALK